jgi:hypothetical protein
VSPSMFQFHVGVFEHPKKRSVMLMAYTRDYNPQWSGCCLHEVEAPNGSEAKRIAMAEHRERCMAVKAGGAR